jgi:TRAP-type C4-dicarboxylate transport system substrate-binding protein
VLLGLLLAGEPARAQSRTLRLATVVPDGSGFAREIHAFTREVETLTHGEVIVKWYFGGVAGDEVEVADRIARGQLDGTASGGMMCTRLSPSMRALRVQGLFQTASETSYVLGRLRTDLEHEFLDAGFVLLGTPVLGPDILFSRTPVRTLADLRKIKLWRWQLDESGILMSRTMGMQIVPGQLTDANRLYDEGQVDGFIAIPSGALAFQWSSRVRYVTDLRMGFLAGCMLLTQRGFDRLSLSQQQVVRAAAAKASIRIEDMTRQQDAQLIGGLFHRQGLESLPASSDLRTEFFAAGRRARDQLGETLAPQQLLQKTLAWLADFRAEHTGP